METSFHSGGTTSSLVDDLQLKHWGQCSAWLGGRVEEVIFVINARIIFANLILLCCEKFEKFFFTLWGYEEKFPVKLRESEILPFCLNLRVCIMFIEVDE